MEMLPEPLLITAEDKKNAFRLQQIIEFNGPSHPDHLLHKVFIYPHLHPHLRMIFHWFFIEPSKCGDKKQLWIPDAAFQFPQGASFPARSVPASAEESASFSWHCCTLVVPQKKMKSWLNHERSDRVSQMISNVWNKAISTISHISPDFG